MLPTLIELATLHRADKWNSHWYAQHYDRHFLHLRGEPINLLEIGVGGYSEPDQGGASLCMWRDYFPRARIHGLDLHPKTGLEGDRIRIFQGDQTDRACLEALVAETGPLDIVVDDGSHVSAHVIATFEILFPLLRSNGMYAVEDVQTSYWPSWGGSLDRDASTTSMGFLKQRVDGLNYPELPDPSYVPSYFDRNIVGVSFYQGLAIIQKGEHREASNWIPATGPRRDKIIEQLRTVSDDPVSPLGGQAWTRSWNPRTKR